VNVIELEQRVEEQARANTLLTLKNEMLEDHVLLLMNDIEVLNDMIGAQE
jgi:hypothetical protein